jgi:energy-coupling factor transporter ATP-binding protein EcfA2
MIEESPICPYTGLRPFTEDESLYFKGRDEHIDEATRQLAKNKFIMLTGASGDGKSSLVYAGILPNAKAGFLKSQFSNWAVADFRPERNPLGNLCHALAKQLGIANEATVRTELSHGFSALVDVYKASSLYLDTVEEDFTTLDDQQKSKRKRHAANLIIIADQFEEFFTNPENFHKGVPSQEASLVTNLLLETARIALEENLPIYVIITMRSDFIGQCASFRGLPEAIGFSQFFVPRLNRTQLQEVIEEPAVLSGNKISRRLTERLIYDMVEGTDQLPILQHALNQIWKMANGGRSEMDLLHYAMVGGMKGTELQAKEAADFEKWFRELPANIQACYHQPGLQNVLNTHANKLNNFALLNKNVSEAEAQQIIETAFKCLTKIDNSRAVRNRMTLNEITAVINQPHLDYKKVGQVLSVFRESGNTLLRPFTDEVPELSGESVLDITHESLIRNWENLAQWAKDEFNSYTIYLDFSQQLNRWVDSDRASSFLLYIGPLTFFENWFEKTKPNTEWIARYLGEEMDHEQRQAKAGSILRNAQEFLQRSARKHAVTRAVMKYGPRKIAAALAVVAFIGLSSFAFKTYLDRRNVAVLENIKEQSFSLFNNPKLSFASRAILATEQLRTNITTIPEVIDNVKAPLEKIVMANGIAAALVFEGRTEPAREIAQAIAATDSLLSAFKPDFTDGKKISDYLKQVNEFRATLGLAYFYNSTEALMRLQQENATRSAQAVLTLLEKTPGNYDDILNFTFSLETALNFNAFSRDELARIINALSSFESSTKSAWVTDHFKRDKLLIRGYQGYGFNFNGLYQELALLYAADDNVAKSLRAIDTLLKYNEPYYQRDYTNMLDNAANVASVLYRTGRTELLDTFVTGYCQHKKMTEIEFYQRLLGRAQPYNLSRNSNYQNFWPEAHNINLSYGEEKEVTLFYQKFREAVIKSTNANEKNFLLALSYKDEAITIAHKAEAAGKNYDRNVVTSLFDKSIAHYNLVSSAYLNETIDQAITASADLISAPRSRLFLFPDIIYPFVPQGARDFHFNYMSVSFMEYLIDKNLFSSYYKEAAELKLFEAWLTDYHYHVSATDLFMRQHADANALAKIEKALARLNGGTQLDLNLLYLYLGSYALDKGDQPLALQYYSKLNVENFGNLLRYKIGAGIVNPTSFRLMGRAFICYLQNNKPAEAKPIIDFFKKSVNRSSLYAAAARELSAQNVNPRLAGALLDSAIVEMNRVENLNSDQPNRYRIAVGLLTQAPTEQSIQQAKGIIKNQAIKFIILQRMARALAYRGELYKATEVIPGNISDADQMEFLWNMVRGYAERMPTASEWREYQESYLWYQRTNFLFYVDETN